MKLYEYESNYRDALNDAIYQAENGCTIKDIVENIGFNNATLLNPYEEDTDTKDIENIYDESYIYEKMDEKMKNCEVVLSSTYEDFDLMTCAIIELKNKEDWELFKKLEVK